MTHTNITLVVDRSGSMSSIRTDMEGALSQFIKEQAKLPGSANVTLWTFDSSVEKIFSDVEISKVENIKIEPRGMTAMHDGIGKAVNHLLTSPATMRHDSFQKVAVKYGNEDLYKKVTDVTNIVVIVTDGGENSSYEYTLATSKALVAQAQEMGVEFVFLGANQNAVLTASGYGIGANSTITYGANSRGVNNVSASLGSYTTSLRSTGVASFTDADRLAAVAE